MPETAPEVVSFAGMILRTAGERVFVSPLKAPWQGRYNAARKFYFDLLQLAEWPRWERLFVRKSELNLPGRRLLDFRRWGPELKGRDLLSVTG
jgi:hypothetical protein